MTRTGCFLDFYGKTARTVEVHLVMAPLRIPSFRFASPCIPQHTRHSLVLSWSPHLGQSTLPYLTLPRSLYTPSPRKGDHLRLYLGRAWRRTTSSLGGQQKNPIALCKFSVTLALRPIATHSFVSLYNLSTLRLSVQTRRDQSLHVRTPRHSNFSRPSSRSGRHIEDLRN